MSDTDWYAKRLGTQPQERQEATPPTQFTPMPGTFPAPPAQAPVPHPASPQFNAPQRFEQETQVNWADLSMDERREFVLKNPKPGAGNRDAQSCPECGSGNLYSRRNSAGMRNTNTFPSPQCYDCGWPLVQSGSVGGALGNG